MRDCFDHYMRGETYDHIRMDLLFNIYGFSASVWKDTVGRDGKTPAVPDEKGMDQSARLRVLETGTSCRNYSVTIPGSAGWKNFSVIAVCGADFRRAPRRNGSQEIFWE